MVRKQTLIGAAIGFTAAAAYIALHHQPDPVEEIPNTGPVEVDVDPDEDDAETPDIETLDTEDTDETDSTDVDEDE